jgi:MFS family permease
MRPVVTTETNGDRGVGAAARSVAEHASALARLELQLAALELKAKVASLGLGVGMLAGAALFGFFVLALLATALPVWAALLVTAGVLAVGVGVLALVGLRALRRATPPVPERAIEEARRTTEAIRG